MNRCEVCNRGLDPDDFCLDCDYVYNHRTDRMEPPADGKISKERAAKQADEARPRKAGSGDFVLRFGEHDGKPIREVPVRYLDWLLSCAWFHSKPKVRDHLENDRRSEWEALERK